MRFTCSQQALTKALNTVSKAVTSRTTIPILKGILLEAAFNNELKLSASDLDLSIEKKIEVSVAEPGSVVVSAKLFSDIVRKLPSGDVEFEEVENGNIRIRCRNSEFTILGQSSEEFPNMGEIIEESHFSMDKELFKNMIRKTSFAASIDESKGIIVGVLMDMTQDEITMVALDGFRMAVNREHMTNDQPKRMVIAARILNEINKIVMDAEEDEELIIQMDEKKAVVLLGSTRVILRLLEGEFIRYEDILPKQHQCRVVVDRQELLGSIERASLLAREGKNNLIKMTVADNAIEITSRSEEGNVKEQVSITQEGEGLEIGFNSKYVLDVLKAVDDEEIAMEFNTSITPCLIKPIDGNAFEYLVLPVRIQNN